MSVLTIVLFPPRILFHLTGMSSCHPPPFSPFYFLLHLFLFLIHPGVQILERTTVQQVVVEKDQVMAVETDRGSIECEYFVNCAGQVNLGVKLWDTNR